MEAKTETPAVTFYDPNTRKWLYFGWENDRDKSVSTMGGALYPGGANGERHRTMSPICYNVSVDGAIYNPDETSPACRRNTHWYLADGYMNSPVSRWTAGDTGLEVTIQHVANRVLADYATVVFTKVTLRNTGDGECRATLNVSASASREVPLNAAPIDEGTDYAIYAAVLPAGDERHFDFAALAYGQATRDQLEQLGSFDAQYAAVKEYYDRLLARMALPVSLPRADIAHSYVNSMIVMWETVVRQGDDYQIRGSAGNRAGLHGYDAFYPHDVPNMVEQFVRDGRPELAMRILESRNYQQIESTHGGNLDAIPKYILPYAALWQVSDERQRQDYFTDEIKAGVRHYAEEITRYMTGTDGLIQKSESLDNNPYDYLVVDDFTALHGLTAYRYLCREWGWDDQAEWAAVRLTALNYALNCHIKAFMKRHDSDWYMCALNDDSVFLKRRQGDKFVYDGNWISSSLMMSTFPWDAVLRGFDRRGAWSDHFEATMDNAVAMKRERGDIPENSWGAWWGHEYGSVYNVGQGIGLLFSDRYRTACVKGYEWLMDNQTAPCQWAESFDRGQSDDDWTNAAIDYETWGLGFLRQGLLEATVSVAVDGTVIIGRGIPDEWLRPGATPIEWQNIAVNDGRRFHRLKLWAADPLTIRLELTGDDALGDILLNLPLLRDNIAAVSIGHADGATGTVTLPRDTKQVTVTLNRPLEGAADPQ